MKLSLDGTRNDEKLSSSEWRRRKAGDNIERLPIANNFVARVVPFLYVLGQLMEYNIKENK